MLTVDNQAKFLLYKKLVQKFFVTDIKAREIIDNRGMPPVFKKQKRATLMDQALNEIRKAIRSGKLKPGDRLVERQLAEAMQISRFPIREALRYLEKEGLVETKPFMGTYVTQLSQKDMEELYSLRSAIEELAVRILIENIDPEKINTLETILSSMEKASQDEKLEKMISEDLRFHQSICELSGHRKLLQVWLMLENQLRLFMNIEKDLFETASQYVVTHHPILDAIKNRDPKLAEEKIRGHLNLGMQVIRQGYWEKTLNAKQVKGKK